MKNFFKKYREIFGVALYVCLIGLIIYFVAKPLYEQIKIRRDQIQEEVANQEGRKKKLIEIPKIKEQYEKVKGQEENLAVLLDKNDAVSLIERLEKLAQNTQNEIRIAVKETDANSREALIARKNEAKAKADGDKTVSIIDGLVSKDYLQVTITLSGQYNNIVDFMQKLENMQNYSDIISFDIKRDSGNSGSANVNPFANQGGVNQEQPPTIENKVVATLETVFYLKK